MPGNAIKNFFKRKRDQIKFGVSATHRSICVVGVVQCSHVHSLMLAFFKAAGPGRKLNASDSDAGTSKPRRNDADAYVPPNRSELTPEARAAADAALARVQSRATTGQLNTSLAAIRMQVKRELEAEKLAKQQAASPPASSSGSTAGATAPKENTNLAVQGVFFR